MGFTGFYLTNKGAALLAKAVSGTTMEFTRAAIGSGDVPSGTAIEATTDLYAKVKDVPLADVTAVGGHATFQLQIVNNDVSTEFKWKEVGVYANDPEEGEILYAYGNAGENADTIPASTAGTVELTFNMVSNIANGVEVEVTVNQGVSFATTDDIGIAKEVAIASANKYADEAADNALKSAKEYTNTKDAETLTSAKEYANEVGAGARASASEYLNAHASSQIAHPELFAGKADGIQYNNGLLQLLSQGNAVGLPVSIALGGTINAFVSGVNNGSFTATAATNTFTIPSFDNTQTTTIIHNNLMLVRGVDYEVSAAGEVILAYNLEANETVYWITQNTTFDANDLENKDIFAPQYTYGTTDLSANSSKLATGTLYFVYE